MKWSLLVLVSLSFLFNICIAIAAFFLIKRYSSEPVRFDFDLRILKRSLRYGLGAYFGLVTAMLHLRLDIFLIGNLQGSVQVGFYAVAVSLAEGIQYIDTSILDAVLFKLTSQTQGASTELTCRTSRHTTFIMVIVAGFLMMLSYPLIRIVYGLEYLPSVSPLILLIPGVVALAISRPLSAFIAFQLGRPKVNFVIVLGALGINIALNLRLIPLYGISGAALASTISYSSILILTAWIFRKIAKVGLSEIFLLTRQDMQVYLALITQAKFFIRKRLAKKNEIVT